jgi:hypothetical protein
MGASHEELELNASRGGERLTNLDDKFNTLELRGWGDEDLPSRSEG